MRSPVVLLPLVLLAGAPTGGCALVGDPCAAPVTGTATYVSGSVPPPYHYTWTVRLEATSGSVTYSPGYGSTESWTQTFTPDATQVAQVCRSLRGRHDGETLTGGGTLTVRWRGDGGRTTQLDTPDSDAADLVRSAVPTPAWDAAEGAYAQWQRAQRR